MKPGNEMKEPENGILYLAFGSVYLAKALYSAETARKRNPGVGICIISNVEFPGVELIPFWDERFDKWIYVPEPSDRNRQFKTNIVKYSPFKKNIYIDCDTFVTGSLSLAWVFLDYFDICLRFQEGKQTHKHLAEYDILDGVSTPFLPHWSGGVVLFNNNERVRRFFHAWNENFNASGLEFDQPSLVKTIFETDIRLLSLDTRWNGGFKPLDRDDGSIALIVHYHSMYDARIERKLRFYHHKLSTLPRAEKARMDEHISERNYMRAKKEHLRFLLRRLYRRWWYRKYLPEGA